MEDGSEFQGKIVDGKKDWRNVHMVVHKDWIFHQDQGSLGGEVSMDCQEIQSDHSLSCRSNKDLDALCEWQDQEGKTSGEVLDNSSSTV